MSLELFCYGDSLSVVQFSATVRLKCYLLHYLWHNSNTIIKNLLKMQNDTILLHIYCRNIPINLIKDLEIQDSLVISKLKIYGLTSLESLVKRSPPRRKSSIRYNFPSV